MGRFVFDIEEDVPILDLTPSPFKTIMPTKCAIIG